MLFACNGYFHAHHIILGFYNSYKDDFPVSATMPNEDVKVFPFGKDCPTPEKASKPDTDILEDEEYFMALACLAAQRSKDPARQVFGIKYYCTRKFGHCTTAVMAKTNTACPWANRLHCTWWL